jgi:hypothetical protein
MSGGHHGAVAGLLSVLWVGVPAVSGASGAAAAAHAPALPPRDGPLVRLSRPISIELAGRRLQDAIAFIGESCGVAIEPLWADDGHAQGLDPERLVTLRAAELPALTVLERVLACAAGGDAAANSWQLSEAGVCQVGPKERLNQFPRIAIYDISDLLREAPDYTETPVIDLRSVLQAGGGRSPFRNEGAGDRGEGDPEERVTRAGRVARLITELIEPEQWAQAGGAGASVRVWEGALIIRAPGYIHRQIDGP